MCVRSKSESPRSLRSPPNSPGTANPATAAAPSPLANTSLELSISLENVYAALAKTEHQLARTINPTLYTRAEFKRLHREMRDTTMIYATPDQIEALSMGNRIGVLREGRIVQIGAPQILYSEPRDQFVASLVGDPPINLIAATLKDVAGKRTLELPFIDIDAAPWATSLSGFPIGSKLMVGVRPQAISPEIEGHQTAAGLRFQARVFLTEPLGDLTILDIVARPNQRLKMVLPQERAFGIANDSSIECTLRDDEICLFAQETGTAIRRNGASPTN